MPEVYDISNKPPEEPEKQPAVPAAKPKSGIQVGSTDSTYKPKHKGRPKPVDPRVVKMRLVGLGLVIALALAFIGFQVFGGKKEPVDLSKQGVTANPNIAAPVAARQTPAKPTYGAAQNRAIIPGINAGAGESAREREDHREGIH
jgi:hypothetical protein